MAAKNIPLLPVLAIHLCVSTDEQGVESRNVVLKTSDQGNYGFTTDLMFDASAIARAVEKLWADSAKPSKQEAA